MPANEEDRWAGNELLEERQEFVDAGLAWWERPASPAQARAVEAEYERIRAKFPEMFHDD